MMTEVERDGRMNTADKSVGEFEDYLLNKYACTDTNRNSNIIIFLFLYI